MVAIDAKKSQDGVFEVFINGGKVNTGLDAVEWAKTCESLGAGEILLTSMDKDGVKSGYDLELTRKVSEAVNIPVIASEPERKIFMMSQLQGQGGLQRRSFTLTSLK